MNQPIQVDKLKDFVAKATDAIGKVPPFVMVGPDGTPIWGQSMIISFLCEHMVITNPNVGEFRVTGFDDLDEFDFAIVRVAECGSPEEREYLEEFEARAKEVRDKREHEQNVEASANELPQRGWLIARFFRFFRFFRRNR